jgi:NAD(P)H-dependent FMN reductase
MKIAIIAGSHRPDSQSGKVARYIASRLPPLAPGASGYVLELGKTPLPLWDEDIWKGSGPVVDAWRPVSQEIAPCDAVVVVAPEWAGMVPAALKNFFLLASDGCLYHKPALIVGVSASRNGAYPVAELRMSSYKNTHLHYIPEQVIVRSVGEVLNGGEAQSEEDGAIRRRIDYALAVLLEYGKALSSVRASGVLNRKEFPYGM